RALRRIEPHFNRAVACGDHRARLIGLAVTRFRGAAQRRTGREACWRLDDPLHIGTDHDVGEERRMIRALCDDELVALDALLDDVPRRVRSIRDAADPKTVPLPERVERKALVRAERRPVEIDDRPRLRGDVAAEKLGERALADEADAGA